MRQTKTPKPVPSVSKPRVGIVRLSTIAKYGRLDAGFYVGGDVDDARADAARAQKRLAAARQALAEAETRLAAAQDRYQALLAAGEVVVPAGAGNG